MGLFIVAVLVVAIPPLAALYWGWAASVLWGWFVVPLGAPTIGAFHAAGLALTVGLLFQSNAKSEDAAKWWLRLALAPLLALAFGALYRALGGVA